MMRPRMIKGYREFASGWTELKPRRVIRGDERNPAAISENPKAEAMLAMIKSQKLTIKQISRRTGMTWAEVEQTLIWMENHVCLFTEDETGRLQIYEEGK